MSVRTPSSTPAGGTGGPPTEPPYPWRLFAGMLLVILVGGAILAWALGLNPLTFQRSGPAIETTPVPATATLAAANTPVQQPTPLVLPTLAPVAAPTAAPATAAGPQTVPTPQPASTPDATRASAAAPTLGPGESATPVITGIVEPTPVQAAVPADLAAAIIQGYDQYWSVRVQAMKDPGNAAIDLESVMAGDELSIARKTLAEYRNDGQAFETTVKHKIWITQASTDQAEIVDEYTASTLKVDPETKAPVESQPEVEQLTGKFALHSFEGTWKVVTESYQ